MQYHLLWTVFVTYFSFFNKCETKPRQPRNGLSYILSLFENRDKPPIIFYLPRTSIETVEENQSDLRENPNDLRNFEYDEDEDSEENLLRTTQNDERAYILYHMLRTTINEEDLDPVTVQELESAKEFLRGAFRGRCRKLKQCERQCPSPKKKQSCTVQCKQIFDDLDECDKPKENKCGEPDECENKCNKPKCGHTMPPKWLL